MSGEEVKSSSLRPSCAHMAEESTPDMIVPTLPTCAVGAAQISPVWLASQYAAEQHIDSVKVSVALTA